MAVFRTIRSWHAPLAWAAVFFAVMTAVSAVGYAVDDRVLVGIRIWAKPLKFAISFGIYGTTLAWMIDQLSRARPGLHRFAWWAGTGIAVANVAEQVLITAQVVRGRQSHFNVSTPLDQTIYVSMGVLISVVWVLTLLVAVLLLLSPLRDRATAWALRLGVVIALFGLSDGFLMLAPTPEQQAQGEASPLMGAHAVGVTDGGPGLPFLGWSTTGGDLRVAHFLGMHALQALPLVALALAVLPVGRRLSERTRLLVVLSAGAAYAGLVALTFWQALRGQALLSPDAPTLVGLAVVAAVAAVGSAVTARSARSDLRSTPDPVPTRRNRT